MLTEDVIILGSQDLSNPYENERVNTFIDLNIWSRQNPTSNAQVGWECTVAAFLKTKFIQKHKPKAVFLGFFYNKTL